MNLFNQDRLRLLITDSCNLACSYCHNEGQFGQGQFMTLEAVEGLAQWLKENSIYVKSLILSGGEPSIHPQLLEIVHLLRDSAQSLSIVTNGTRLSAEKIDELAAAGLSYIKFGIDAVDTETTKGPLDRTPRDLRELVIENALHAAEVMPGSHLNTVVSAFNSARIRPLLQWCDEHHIGVKFLELIDVRPEIRDINPFSSRSQHAWFGQLLDTVADLLSDVEYNPKVMKFYARTRSGQVVQFSENFCWYGACSSLWTRIDSHSRLVPCIHKPVTRELELTATGLAQTRAVNQEMRNTPAWPCGLAPLRETRNGDELSEQVSLPEQRTIAVPLTDRSSCVA